MPNYQKTVIYKIYCKDANITEFYIGHTTNFISRRDTHKSHCHNEKSKDYNKKLYTHIRNNGGWNNFNMVEIEKYPCNNKKEASLRENYWVKELKSSLNIQVPLRTNNEWREDNKEILIEYRKEYYEKNKEKIKEYRQKNKKKIAQKDKEYYEKNKEIISEKAKEKISCDICNIFLCKKSLLRHKKEQHEGKKRNK